MTDRLFADCCYGTDWQHGENEPCPVLEHASIILDAGMLMAGPLAVADYLRDKFEPRDGPASAIEARQGPDPKGLDAQHESAAPKGGDAHHD